MDVVSTIAAALGSVKTATEIAKFFRETDRAFERAEAKSKIVELMEALSDAKLHIIEIRETVADKDSTIKQLNDRLALRGKVRYEAPSYWLVDGEARDGPFCQKCKDADDKLVRLQDYGEGGWYCLSCQKSYEKGDPEGLGRIRNVY